MLTKRPGFSAIVVLVLGLGIGANTAVFTLVSKVLLSPLPFREPERLMIVQSTDPPDGIDDSNVSGPDFRDWRKQNRSFEDLIAFNGNCRFSLTGRGEPLFLKGAQVTPSMFPVFGLRMAHGRGLVETDAEAGQEYKLVLMHGFWQRQFGGDPGIVGQSLTINGHAHEVVGVAAPTLGFIEEMVDAMAPLSNAQLSGGRMNHYLNVFGRLKPGVSPEQALTDLNVIAEALGREYPDQKDWRVKLKPLQQSLVQSVRPAFLILHGAVAFVLLIACVNVASMLLARGEARSRELAIRASLGAGRWQIIGQLLTESLVLSLASGVVGVVLAKAGIVALRAMNLQVNGQGIPFFNELSIDPPILWFALAVSLVTGLLFGLAPAWHAARTQLADSLREAGRTGGLGRSGHRVLKTFVVSQVALSVVLLVGAGLMARNLQNLVRINPGFDPRNVLAMDLELPPARYNGEQVTAFYREVLRRLATIPGVESAALSNILPMANNNSNWGFEIEGEPPLPKGRFNSAEYRVVNPGYFEALRVPLVRGRGFTAQDDGKGLRVVIINETLAKRFLGESNPLGRRLHVGGSKEGLEIVGVVGDEKYRGLGSSDPAVMYQPFEQNCWHAMSLAVRTQGEPTALAGTIRREVWAVDPDQPISRVRRMTDDVRNSVAIQDFATRMLLAFAGVGLFLAAMGLYGVLAYAVSQRVHEIGVRMALGANLADVLGMILRQGAWLTGVGLAVGLGLSLALSRVLQSLLYQMSALDPLTFAGVAVLLALVAGLACYLPARRAAQVDPTVALRCE